LHLVQISVVIPSYNRAHTLQRALLSVLGQTSAADEIIVVDDGSTDHSAMLIQQYPTVKLIQQPNKGVSAARNTGIRAATSEWIALLDSDDEWLTDKLSQIRQAQQDHPNIKLFHSNEIWIRNGVRVNPMNKHNKYGGDIFQYCLPLCVISPSAVVLHRSLFDECGLFNENLPACEDYDLWLRICHRHPVVYLPQELIKKYGGHDDQLSRRFWGMDRFRIQSLHELMQQKTLTSLQQQQTRSMLVKKLKILIKGAIKHNNQQVLHQFQPMLEQYEAVTC
jgi:glycosyltransferase involved in cell wall biosynthesis